MQYSSSWFIHSSQNTLLQLCSKCVPFRSSIALPSFARFQEEVSLLCWDLHYPGAKGPRTCNTVAPWGTLYILSYMTIWARSCAILIISVSRWGTQYSCYFLKKATKVQKSSSTDDSSAVKPKCSWHNNTLYQFEVHLCASTKMNSALVTMWSPSLGREGTYSWICESFFFSWCINLNFR